MRVQQITSLPPLLTRFLVPIAFQQTNRPVPVVYSLNTEFQLCNNEKVFMMDPATADVSMAEMDYKGAFSMGRTEGRETFTQTPFVQIKVNKRPSAAPRRSDLVWPSAVEP